jgi:plasmid stabilization system protein ParE
MRVVWAPLALIRVEAIAGVIAADRPAVADRWLVAVFDRVKQLQAHPDSGGIVPELDRAEIRQLLYGRYRIIYRRDPSRIVILTVRHSRQAFDTNALGEASEE